MGHPEHVLAWAARFALLGDPSRLMLLLVIHDEGPICVSDLAAATGLKHTTVSHSLRLLRAHDMVRTERSGQMVCYRLTDHSANALLEHVLAPNPADHHP